MFKLHHLYNQVLCKALQMVLLAVQVSGGRGRISNLNYEVIELLVLY